MNSNTPDEVDMLRKGQRERGEWEIKQAKFQSKYDGWIQALHARRMVIDGFGDSERIQSKAAEGMEE